MNTILCIDERTPEAIHAVQFALELAWKTDARLILGVAKAPVPAMEFRIGAMSGQSSAPAYDPAADTSLSEHLDVHNYRHRSKYPLEELDISGMNMDDLAHFVNQNAISVIVKGTDGMHHHSAFNQQNLLNKVLSPLLLIPPQPLKLPARLVYLTDLRYCRTDLLRRLLDLTSQLKTSFSIAHMPAPGLPDLAAPFALEIFSELCKKCHGDDRLFLHHIPDQPIATVADVLINGMQYDGLVLANHSPHYRLLIEERILMGEPGLSGTPLLLYPG